MKFEKLMYCLSHLLHHWSQLVILRPNVYGAFAGYFVVVGWLVDEDRGDIKGDIVGGGGGGFFLVLLFFEDAAVRVEVVAEIIEALLRGSELAGANGVVEDDDGEERA
ncbi:uncharacterized protein DS421_5g146840 [Arachis hypogaea]|nr:uncharacterized protein DS421_5g146840 [Arachis hypogaea]